MKFYLKLAWRNIWRSKRRSLITAASILFAVFFACAMRSIQLGAYGNMIDNVVGFYLGYIQIHQDGYWEERSLDKSFVFTDNLIGSKEEAEGITFIPRIESFGLVSVGNLTKGAMVVGIEPDRERLLTEVDKKIVEGSYLNHDDKSILLAEGLASYFKVSVGDTLIIISQGYHGINAAAMYPIKGLMKFGSPELNDRLIYLPLKEAKWFYGTGDLITTVAIALDDYDRVDDVKSMLAASLDNEEYEVMDWTEMMPELVQLIEFDSAGGQIMLFILYVIISFGVFGTILMLSKERQHEFGVLLAIGMKRRRLQVVTWLEIMMLGFLGAFSGILLSFPLIFYFHVNPLRFTGKIADAYEKFGMEAIFPFSIEPGLFITQAVTVFVIVSVISIYPMVMISRLKVVKAMRD